MASELLKCGKRIDIDGFFFQDLTLDSPCLLVIAVLATRLRAAHTTKFNTENVKLENIAVSMIACRWYWGQDKESFRRSYVKDDFTLE